MNWYKIATESLESTESLEPEPFPDKEWVKVDSSFIDSVAYYEMARVLEVKFKNGEKYTLMNISPKTYKYFLDSPSKGTFFNLVLKKNPLKT